MPSMKTIPGFSRYAIDTEGTVWSLITSRARALRPYCRPKDGCCTVILFDDAHRAHARYVHQLVARTFIGPPAPGQEVNHRDGDRTNNRLSNLEWMTRSENQLHSRRVLGRHAGVALGNANGNVKVTKAVVRTIRRSSEGSAALAARYGITRCSVWQIRTGRTWAHA